jgi:predicted TIM-barrel fold metal-dependent hydrolase
VIDVHQHVLPAGLIDGLRQRRQPPRLRGWLLELVDEPALILDAKDHDVSDRAALAAEDGLELALVSLSSALGIETLPAEEAEELLDAYHEGVLRLPPPFGAWAAASLTEPDPAGLRRRLDQGFVGLQLPATALRDASGYAHAAPLLQVLEERGRPLFIHPGPPGGQLSATPPWWPALVPYVQQMHAAWFAFRVHGRPAHPELRVCFALLAGLAPLHGERLAARGGGRSSIDPDAFLDISSYGTRAVDATVRVLGVDVLVNGSDRPYAAPVDLELGDAVLTAVARSNPRRLLDTEEVIDVLDVAAGA